MKYSLNFIKDHFGYCMEEGMLFGEDEEILILQLYDKAEKAERYEHHMKEILEKHSNPDKHDDIDNLKIQIERIKQKLEEALEGDE